MGAFGDTIIYILYGSQWISASEYIIYLAIALAISSLNLFYENILVSTDNQKLFLRFNLILSIAKILIACSIFFAPLTKVLELIIYMNLGRLFFVCFSLKHLLDFKLKSQISAFKGPIISSLLLIIVAFLYKQIQENIIEWMMLPVFGLSVVIWAFSIIVFDRELIKFVLKTN